MWPDSAVKYFKDALPADILEGVRADAEALSHTDNFWIPKERILAGQSACTTPAELAVCLLYHQHVVHHLPDDWRGAEYWLQVYKPGVGLGFHFDKDEHLLKATGKMSHPIWSSIMYLTGSSSSCSSSGSSSSSSSSDDDWDGARQAATVILQQYFDPTQGYAEPQFPAKSVIVWPKRNSYCLFDGRLGHGVLNSSSSSQRMTLLVNWWRKQPMAVHELPDSQIEQLRLTRLRSSYCTTTLHDAAAAAAAAVKGSSSGTKVQQQQQSSAGISATIQATNALQGLRGNDTPADKKNTTRAAVRIHAVAAASSSSGSSSGEMNRLHCCKVTVSDLDTDGVQMVDAVVAANKMHLTGPAAVDILAFEHPGMILYPIEPANAECNYSDNASPDGSSSSSSRGKLQTLAAFVSLDMVEDEEDDSSSSSSSHYE